MAIQSADQKVLDASGRGKIKLESLRKQIAYFHESNIDVLTDILIGLPEETSKSHQETLEESFNLGFDIISPIQIRLLKGTDYETARFRENYVLGTKFRPIFGAYGVYEGRNIFEVDESIRSTKDMSEVELNHFKVHHWLIYLCWNSGVFKPILRFALQNGINPTTIIDNVTKTEDTDLSAIFAQLRDDSMNEWFSNIDEMEAFYSDNSNFNSLMENFIKLNFKYIAILAAKPELLRKLQVSINLEIGLMLKKELHPILDLVTEISDNFLCVDLLADSFAKTIKVPFSMAKYFVKVLPNRDSDDVELEIFRDRNVVNYCKKNLNRCDDGSISSLEMVKFLEIGGLKYLTNQVRVIG